MPNLAFDLAAPPLFVDLVGTPSTNTGSLTSTAGTAYVLYKGITPVPISNLAVFFYIHGVPAVGAGWSEVAVYTSPNFTYVNLDTSSEAMSLTCRGWASIDTEAKVASTAGYWKNISLSTPIPAGSPIWLGVAGSYATTQASFRIYTDGVIVGDAKSLADGTGATTRPSLNVGVARTFTGNVGSVVVSPVLSARLI